jgi:hypothetical protein
MDVPTPTNPEPPAEEKWAPGAEPLAVCMSCSSTYPPETSECPNCHVSLSVVRKCPSCGRVQSAQHFACIYCADSFLREEGLMPPAAGPLARRRESAQRRFLIVGSVALAAGVAAGLVLFLLRSPAGGSLSVIAQSYVLHPCSMHTSPSPDAAPAKDFQGSEIVNITDYAIDMMGNRWFRITSEGVGGYIRTQDVAPPKARDPEKGFEALRHWLLGMGDASVLGEAQQAVDFYRSTYPTSPHGDEIRWLLAERTRALAAGSSQRRALLASAREQYQKIAEEGGEYAARAREALENLPTGSSFGGPRRSVQPSTLGFSVVGGSVTPSHDAPEGTPGAPVRRVTVLTRTPLYVRLPSPVQLSAGTTFEARFAQDIWVNKEIAIPQGSAARIAVSGTDRAPSLRIVTAVIAGKTYQVSASISHFSPTGRSGTGSQNPFTLPSGTRLEFRLDAPLVVTHR